MQALLFRCSKNVIEKNYDVMGVFSQFLVEPRKVFSALRIIMNSGFFPRSFPVYQLEICSLHVHQTV